MDLIKEYYLIARLQALARKIKTPPADWKNGEKNPILLIPGFGETFVFLKPLADRLHEFGYPIHILSPIDMCDSVEHIAQFFAIYIRSNKLTNIICLSHSKGGCIAKYLMDNFPNINKQIRKSISLASPYQGSLLGYLNIRSSYELTPNGKVTLESAQHSENNYKIIALYSKIDNHVLPNKNLLLPGATNIRIDIVGHTRILTTSETFKIIKQILGN